MYAIIEDGSHQFRLSEGDRVQVDRRNGKAGDEPVFSKVFFIAGVYDAASESSRPHEIFTVTALEPRNSGAAAERFPAVC